MPWKNGGGETAEIAVSPPGAALDDFDWRLSMARVETDGPFSAFPGIDRTLVDPRRRGHPPRRGRRNAGHADEGSANRTHFPLTRRPSPIWLAGRSQTSMSCRGAAGSGIPWARLKLAGPVDIARVGDMVIFCAEGSVILETGDGSADLANTIRPCGGRVRKPSLVRNTRALIYLVKIDRG